MNIKTEEQLNSLKTQSEEQPNSRCQRAKKYQTFFFREYPVPVGVIIAILLILLITASTLLFFTWGVYFKDDTNKDSSISQYTKYFGYWYGDQIDFTKLPKRLTNRPDTYLTYQNVDKAASFFNLLGKGDNIQKNQTLKSIAQMEIKYYENKYQITQFEEEIQICVIVTSYKNQDRNRYKANLDSIFQQNYENYFVIYVNDGSPDRTGQLVQKYMDDHPIAKQKMTLINHAKNQGKAYGQYVYAHKYCKPGSIMFTFDGDDNLIGRQVFKLLNALYQKRQAKFVYLNFLFFIQSQPSQYMLLSGFSKDCQKFKKNRDYRKNQLPLHLISYMSDLFLSINQEDLKYDGKFAYAGNDQMLLYTLQQLADQKVEYVPQIVYHYNENTGNNHHAFKDRINYRQQIRADQKAREKFPIYQKKINFRLKKPSKPFKTLL